MNIEQHSPFCKKAHAQLPNAGISLLHHGCPHQAIEALMDAHAVVQLGCHSKTALWNMIDWHLPRLFTQCDSIDIRKVLLKAYGQLSHPQPAPQGT